MERLHERGFTMVDVLVALLLLAVSLTCVCTTLVQAMQATRGALLTMRATDLAADLAEEVRHAESIPQAQARLQAWRERAELLLPVSGMQPEQFAVLAVSPAPSGETDPQDGIAHLELLLRWHDGSGGGARELALPVTIAGDM